MCIVTQRQGGAGVHSGEPEHQDRQAGRREDGLSEEDH